MLSFEEIDKRRVAAGLTRKAVYERAGLDGETWRRTAAGKTLPNTRTLTKLETALEALLTELEQANG
ncbi:hypothetical protein MPL1032_190133 [Mesorhizobium plurifarium]|uniref:HTH cro/C1-type domain-containing protein n=1 Tax=Mesorhizobium plurifarium TaxID=69974 RepID=A0A0K2VUR6_MESPL|nr:hypothetical protein MPL1032_190133 [Mesorhizobium plurifarium]